MKNLIKSVISVMAEVKNIDKNMSIGTGNYAYKGVSDKDVKHKIGEAMQRNGLVIFQTSINPTIQIDRWEENDKQKQSVMTTVQPKYTLYHESGESIELEGYGHGIDAQDKSAGKATTYALKYLLLYTFLVPTGKIDDADNTHTNDKVVPKNKTKDTRTEMRLNTMTYEKAHTALSNGECTIEQIEKKYILSTEIKNKLLGYAK